jgi:two-component system phosphate regulon sensor histidine kinase PhoR
MPRGVKAQTADTKNSESKKSLSNITQGVRGYLKKPGINLTEALIASLGEGLIILDEYGHINQINQPALDMLGFDRADLEGEYGPRVVTIKDHYGRLIPTEERPAFRALLTGQAVSDIVYAVRKDDSEFPVSITATPFVVRGKPKGVVLLYRDVSQQIQMERAKDEFVSIASHQLRGPLTGIRLFSELLSSSAQKKLTPKERSYISRIHFSTEKMLDLVSDFLSISRIELGQMQIRPKPTDLNKVVENRVEEVRPLAESNGVKLSYSCELYSSKEVLLDQDLLGQAIHNLLSNAIRYSQATKKRRGKVNVSLSKSSKYYKICVADNGIGIPPEAKTRIFERFFRAENAFSAESEGTGLGLYLVKEIIEAMGGKITYKSQINKGTTFDVRIPLSGLSSSKSK